jgi:hypothetical protein
MRVTTAGAPAARLAETDRPPFRPGSSIRRRLPQPTAIAVFVVTALSFLRIRLIGELFVVELILAVIVILHVLRYKRLTLEKPLGLVIVLLALWLYGQIFTDIYRESAFVDYARGWARILFTGLNLLGLYLLVGVDATRVRTAFLGLVASQITGYFLAPTVYAHTMPWKFGFAYPLTTLATVIACNARIRRHRLGPFCILGAMAVLNLLLGARSLAGVGLISSFLTTIVNGDRSSTGTASRGRVLTILLLGGLAALMGSYLYASLAASGWLGASAQLKYEMQSKGRYSFLLGGRHQIVFSSLAIRESPIVGHGSFAKGSSQIRDAGVAKLEGWGYEYLDLVDDQMGLLPTHSCIFGMWVDTGVLAVPFWLFFLVLLWRGCTHAIQYGGVLAPLKIFIAMALAWDVLFSPFGADRRLTIPLGILLLLSRR